MDTPPWTEWWQDDLPCQFTREQAKANAEFLAGTLGSTAVERMTIHPGSERHPFGRVWKTRGAGAYLEMNCLAENVRLLVGKPGFDGVLQSLLDEGEYEPSKLVIHVAAMVERARAGSVLRFPELGSERIPDIIVADDAACECPIEVKVMLQSDVEAATLSFARELSEVIHAVMAGHSGDPLAIVIVLKCAHHLPALNEVEEVVRAAFPRGSAAPFRTRRSRFNAFVARTPREQTGVDDRRTCYVLCPVSPKESIRIEGRVRQAAKQIVAAGCPDGSGLLCIGLGAGQSPKRMAAHLRRWFRAGKFHSVSSVMLLNVGAHFEGPQRSVLDLLGFVRNSQLQDEPVHLVPLKCLGVEQSVFLLDPAGAIPAYRHGEVRGTVVVGKADGLPLPDLRHLTYEDLL